MDDDASAPVGSGGAPPPSPDDPLERDAVELRRLIEAGAGTPEELRALAERLREHKALEESRWRADIKPELMAAKRWRNRRPAIADDDANDDQANDAANDDEVRRNLKIGAALLGGTLVLLLLATQASIAFVLLPVLGVMAYAYRQGRSQPGGDEPPDPSPRATDPLA